MNTLDIEHRPRRLRDLEGAKTEKLQAALETLGQTVVLAVDNAA
jgi:hypothetical protein